jgi:hypothetical protein
MLVFESGGTHIKTEFSETGTDITPAEAEYTLHEFAVDLTAIKEMEAV